MAEHLFDEQFLHGSCSIIQVESKNNWFFFSFSPETKTRVWSTFNWLKIWKGFPPLKTKTRRARDKEKFKVKCFLLGNVESWQDSNSRHLTNSWSFKINWACQHKLELLIWKSWRENTPLITPFHAHTNILSSKNRGQHSYLFQIQRDEGSTDVFRPCFHIHFCLFSSLLTKAILILSNEVTFRKRNWKCN